MSSTAWATGRTLTAPTNKNEAGKRGFTIEIPDEWIGIAILNEDEKHNQMYLQQILDDFFTFGRHLNGLPGQGGS
ncbi:hypothetical protein ACIPL1_16530 [Pseudomonas sp. NPDC090202]|uniref:hypothetical protein n=1 Tax=unclassified Pseudomonas TaxID=196821 RepID=UPI0037FF3F0D